MIVTVLLIGYIVVGGMLYVKQKSFLYYPTPKLQTPYESFSFKNDAETINVIVLNKNNKDAILYFGGNAESMAGSSDYIAQQFPEHTIYLMDYRGYGDSTGEASQERLYSDALKLYDMIKPKHRRISIGGRSLGSAIATYVAANREVYKLALITPFDSILNVAQGMYPIYPVSWLLDDKYKSIDNVKDIKAKTFIVYAQNDKVIPYSYTKKLIDAFPPKQLEIVMIEDRGHNTISDNKRYYMLMQDFIGKGR